MLDFGAEEWSRLRVPTGDARRIPSLLAALNDDPSEKNFNAFWDELTGEGDLAICDAFFAAIPHTVAALPLFDGEALEEAIAQIGWGIALAGGAGIPERWVGDFHAAQHALANHATTLLQRGVSVSNRSFIVAAIAAGNGKFSEALSVIDDI